ncbi:MAG TPA: segregation/condensation protein A [Thioploca sp.]|nr:segregation/condensation protein A [Thioploca sp.]
MDIAIPEGKNAVVQGILFEAWPTDLYVPPDALQIFLEGFEGPLDLLLYLIQNQNFDITNIPISTITTQYLKYIELIEDLHLDLAAEYLVMAATLVEIKSRSLLPISEDIKEDDPHAKLVQQLREYAKYKQAAQDLDALPRLERDLFTGLVEHPDIPRQIVPPEVSLDELLEVMQDVMRRATLFTSHQVIKEPLSVRERMSAVLEQLKQLQQIDFINLFVIEEGRAGVVVTLLAILELTKESLIKIVQPQAFAVIQVVSLETKNA